MFSKTTANHPSYMFVYLKVTQLRVNRCFVYTPMQDIGLTRSHIRYLTVQFVANTLYHNLDVKISGTDYYHVSDLT